MSSTNKKIVVTGGSGKAGRACVDDLLANGYEVFVVDRVAPPTRKCPSIVADLTDYGQTVDALSASDGETAPPDAVVHLAALPAPRLQPNSATFRNNTLSDYNVFEASRRLGIKHIVYASSETVLGLPFDEPPPYVPVDEEYAPRPESAYSLCKVLAETMAVQFCRWDSELKIVGLRFSNVMEPHDYERFASFQADAKIRKWNLWGYIDARDAAQAIRLSIESPMRGDHVYIIANADTVMHRSNDSLVDEVFPNVLRHNLGGPNDTLLSIEKARRELGYAPRFSWKGEPNIS
jgi:nucleoside-diphosphate-sugar epimerase